MSNKMREQFETWQVESGRTDPYWFQPGYSWNEVTQRYSMHAIQEDWECWKASRSAMVVELPQPAEESALMDADEVRAAIRTAGIGIK